MCQTELLMKEIIRVIIILNGLILNARSMDDPPPLEPQHITANFSLSVLAFMETFQHQTKGMLVHKLSQEEENPETLPYHSPPPCNPEIPEELYHLSSKLNNTTQQDFTDYLAHTLSTDHFLIQVSERVLSNAHIKLINSSPAQFVLLITTDKTSNLSHFTEIINNLDPRIKVALSDRTVNGINAIDIDRLLANINCTKLYYLALHHINDCTAQKIAECPHLKNLVRLSVEKSYLTKDGVLAFGESPNLPSLKEFSGDREALKYLETIIYTKRMTPFQCRLHHCDWIR